MRFRNGLPFCEMNSRKRVFFFFGLLLVGAAGIFGFFLLNRPPRRFVAKNIAVKRQVIPEPSTLQLPPQISVPSSPFSIPHLALKSSSERKNQLSEKSSPPLGLHKAPSKWAILKKYQQVVELDEKYYEIGLDSDRYGYGNQAAIYYRKYLFVAPSGSHAQQVRSRLAELEGR